MFKTDKNTIIQFDKVDFGYEPNKLILNNVSFSIKKGEHVCVIGANGCGKSTLMKLMVGLFKPRSGSIIFKNQVITKTNVLDLKQGSGIVFENPDNQFVGETVADDIAFGLENKCIPHERMQSIIDNAASFVGISDILKYEPKYLSGGQKQLAAIAAVLATEPELIVFDEVTSMLDCKSKKRINDLLLSIKTKQHKTIVRVTHDMDEVLLADKVIVMSKGHIALVGTPDEVFKNKKLSELSLDKPFIYKAKEKQIIKTLPKTKSTNHIITCEHVDIFVGPKKNKKLLLKDFNFTFDKNKIYAIVGNSGVGKTTLVSHLNGLLKTKQGNIFVKDKAILGSQKKIKNYKAIRKDVGLVFQFPEYQIFKDTVEKDIAFGPINNSVNKEKAKELAAKYLYLVGLDKSLLKSNPFDLSNGQKRLVAIAGILAIEPDVVILDEPTAGLDPYYQKKIKSIIKDLKGQGKTIIIITHNMDNVLELADEVLVLHNQKLLKSGSPVDIFNDSYLLKQTELDQPHLIKYLNKKGGC